MSDPEPTLAGDTDPDASTLSPIARAVADARLAAVVARHGHRLANDDNRARVRRAIERQVDLGEQLRRVPLANHDEPELDFVPFRAPDPDSGIETTP